MDVQVMYSLQESLMHASRNNSNFYACTIDFQNAFCSVPHALILSKVKELGFDDDFTKIIKDTYKNAYSIIQLNGETSNPILIKKGVKQGCPVSPLLFNIALEPLIRRLSNLHHDAGIKIGNSKLCVQAYADDIILLSSSRVGLEQMIKTVERFCNYSDMKLAECKCTVTSYILHEGRRVQDANPFKINNVDIINSPILQFVDYLGAPLSRMTKIRLKHSTPIVNEIKWKLNQLMNAPLRINQKMDVIRRFIVPSFDYSFITNAVKKNDLKEIDTIIRKTISNGMNAKGIPSAFYYTCWRDGGASIPNLREREDCMVLRTYIVNKFFADSYTKKLSNEFEEDEQRFRGVTLSEDQSNFFNWPLDENQKIIQRRTGSNSMVIRAIKANKNLSLNINMNEQITIKDTLNNKEFECTHEKQIMPIFNKILKERWRKKLQELPLKGHSFRTLENSPASSFFMSPSIPAFNDNIAKFAIMGRCNDLPTGEILAHGNQTPICHKCNRGNDTLMHRLNACNIIKSQYKERHNMVVAEVEKAIRINTNQRIRFHRSTQIRMEGFPQLPPDVRSFLPDLWYVDIARNIMKVLEITVPYGSYTDGDDHNSRISTLDKRRTEKKEKYKELIEEIKSTFNMDAELHVIVVSSLGAVSKDTYREISTLLHENKMNCKRTARAISAAAIRGSALIYWGFPIRNGRVVQEQSTEDESESTQPDSIDDLVLDSLFHPQ